jgi:hypothetical protein
MRRRALGAGLHAVDDGVFHQRLQDQRRQLRRAHARVQRPFHAQALAKAHLLDGQVAARQLDLLRHAGGAVLVGQRVPEQVGQVGQHLLGLGRLLAHQGHGLLSVLNRKCGRMRACSSASRAVVAAGMRPRARHVSPATRPAASSAPVQALASQAGCVLRPVSARVPAAYRPPKAPSATPALHCATGFRRASGA